MGLLARVLPWHGPLVADWDDLWTDGGLMGSRPEGGLVRRLAYDLDHAAEKHLKKCADAVTVVSEALRRRAIADGVSEDRVVCLGNGAAIEEFSPGDKPTLRRELGLPLGERVAIFTGFGQYDLEQALDALRRLDLAGKAPVTLVTGPNDELVRAWVDRRGLGHRVKVLGLVPFERLKPLLAAADFGLMPYADKAINHARFPIKLGDYLAAGLPIAGSDVGEVGRIIRELDAGVAAPPTVEGFASAIGELVGAADLAARSTRARAAAEAMSWDSVAATAERLYERVRSLR
jgi:glycosyltransferase involved in cell wall biosynthesis